MEIDDMLKAAREIDHLAETRLGHELLRAVTPERLIRAILAPEQPAEPKEKRATRSMGNALADILSFWELDVGGRFYCHQRSFRCHRRTL